MSSPKQRKPRTKAERAKACAIQVARNARIRDEMKAMPWTNDAMTELRLRHLREAIQALAAARERVLLAANAKEQEQLAGQLGAFEREIVRCRKALGLPALPQEGARR